METSTFGYILGSIILIIIVARSLHYHRKNKLDKPIPKESEIMLENGFIFKELKDTYNTLKDYTDFLKHRIPNAIPEVKQELEEVFVRMRFIRNIITQIEEHDPRKKISQEDWVKILKVSRHVIDMMKEHGPIVLTKEKEKEYNQMIQNLIDQGTLPKDYLTSTQLIDIEKFEKTKGWDTKDNQQ